MLSEANPDILYVGTSYISKSTNAGNSWSLMNGGNELNGSPSISMATSHQDEDVLYVGTSPITTSASVFLTVNGGNSSPGAFTLAGGFFCANATLASAQCESNWANGNYVESCFVF